MYQFHNDFSSYHFTLSKTFDLIRGRVQCIETKNFEVDFRLLLFVSEAFPYESYSKRSSRIELEDLIIIFKSNFTDVYYLPES